MTKTTKIKKIQKTCKRSNKKNSPRFYTYNDKRIVMFE